MSDQTFKVVKGITTHDDRFEPGETVKESQLGRSTKWLLEDGAIEAPQVEATDGAIKLAAAEGIDLGEVTGTGAGGKVTKPDVQKAIAAADEGDDG